MKIVLPKKIWLIFLVLVMGFAIMAYTSYKTARRNVDDTRKLDHTFKVKEKLGQLRSLARDYSFNTTSFLISNDSAYLEKARTNRAHTFPALAFLHYLVASDDAELRQGADSITYKMSRIFAHYGNTINLHTYPTATTALAAIATGNNLVQDMSGTITMLEQDLNLELEQQKANFKTSQKIFIAAVFIMIAGMLVFLTVSYYLINNQVRQRKEAEDEVKAINTNLEGLVKVKAEKLAEQEKRYQFVLDNMMEGIQVLDRQWKYVYINDAAVKQSKTERAQLIGKSMLDIIPVAGNTELFATLKRCMEENSIARFENVFTYSNGSVGYFELLVEPIPEGLFIVSMDITERIRRDQDRQRRLQESRQILHKISHEVRQPVVNILGMSDLLDEQMVHPSEVQEIAGILKRAIAQLDERTRDLSAFVTELDKG